MTIDEAERIVAEYTASLTYKVPEGQISREDLQHMTPEQIVAAGKAGQLDKLLGKDISE